MKFRGLFKFCELVRLRTQRNFSSKTELYEPVIGLEIHAQIASNSKLFSGSENSFAAPVNDNVALFDASIPGTLPVLNRACVETAVKMALALNCEISPVSNFDRKHYFYTDLPNGFQITQQRNPIAKNGSIEFQILAPGKAPYNKCSKLKQLQLEQDSGKSLHDECEKRSLIDLNRAGIPLMEFVFEPDLADGEEAAALVKELCLILNYVGACSCKMEEGALRVDANVSVHKCGEPLGPRTEIKNIGSIRGVASAIKYEIDRQISVLKKSGQVVNETRAWDAFQKATVPMREKEEKQDYRFMPESNLPPLHLQLPGAPNILGNDLVNVGELCESMPKLPQERRLDLIQNYNLAMTQAIVLVNEAILHEYFYEIMKFPNRNSKTVANILIMELLTIVNKENIDLSECKISAIQLGDLIDLLEEENINLLTVRKVLQEIINNNPTPVHEIVNKNNWLQINGVDEIEKICETVIGNNPEWVRQYRNGKTKLFKAFLGNVSKMTENRANMAKVTKKLKELLNK